MKGIRAVFMCPPPWPHRPQRRGTDIARSQLVSSQRLPRYTWRCVLKSRRVGPRCHRFFALHFRGIALWGSLLLWCCCHARRALYGWGVALFGRVDCAPRGCGHLAPVEQGMHLGNAVAASLALDLVALVCAMVARPRVCLQWGRRFRNSY